ncbi:hypothetical protein ADK64_32645 [Streptomyces sp. MMG1121]|nr:hypothetical protein ADK64_32645 [Streptomyces sp. MMG1121]
MSRAMARLTARLRQEWIPWSVRVLNDFALLASQRSTSSALRSRSFRAPSDGITCFWLRSVTVSTVLGSRSARPYASQSVTASLTV